MLIEESAIARILAITDGHPHDTQELCHFAWERALTLGKVVTSADVEAALGDVIEAEDAHYTTLWESLARAQRALVQALVAEQTTSPYTEAFRAWIATTLGSVVRLQGSAAARASAQATLTVTAHQTESVD